MDYVSEAIQQLNEDIKQLENQKELIKSLKTDTVVTEDEWHEICLTPLRTSDLLAVYLKNIFPTATDIKVGVNYVTFMLYDIKCLLPTSAVRGIEIECDLYYYLEQPQYFENAATINLRKFVESDNWNDKTKAISDKSKLARFVLWHTYYKFVADKYEEKYKEIHEDLNNMYNKKMDEYIKRVNHNTEICKTLKEKVLPTLNKFTDKVDFHNAPYKAPKLEKFIKQYF